MPQRRVLVTGGGSGIGLSTVHSLLANGAQVVIADLHLDQVPAELPVTRITANVTNEADVERVFAEAVSTLGGLDAVIHSAGIMREQGRDIREITLESWQGVIDVNLTGAFLVAREAARVMAPSGYGVIVLIGSGAGTTGPSGSIPYGASKGGVNGLAMTLAHHIAPLGIRVHNFLPGSVDTPLLEKSLAEAERNGRAVAVVDEARSRLVSPDGVGRILAFLASADADAVQGNVASR